MSCSKSGGSGSPRVVVAIDFGTTFSGFAYAMASEPNNVKIFTDWPFATTAGSVIYCKTQTSLYYVKDGRCGDLKLQNWAWHGLADYRQACSSLERQRRGGGGGGDVEESVGHFVTRFKLHLAAGDHDVKRKEGDVPALPAGLTPERTIVDYLREMSLFALEHLREKYGKHMTMRDIQWCLTVPAIWEEGAKQMMRNYAAEAGMVRKSVSGDRHNYGVIDIMEELPGSPFPVHIILEPEAASVYCQRKATGNLVLRRGDRLMVADVGGGTIDLVVHQKTDDDPGSMHVEEVVASYGDLGGGTFVDAKFDEFMSNKMGCFKEYCRDSSPQYGNKVHKWWLELKAEFDGDDCFPAAYVPDFPRALVKAWKEWDAKNGVVKDGGPDAYEELCLQASELKAIFEPEVNKILGLIDRHVRKVRVLMVVGGFSASPYLKKRIRQRFGGMVEEIIIPEDPGSAICVGAVQLHMAQDDPIRCRIAKRTYGITSNRDAKAGDPKELLFTDDDNLCMCKNTFSVLVKKGDKVPLDACVYHTFTPSHHNQKLITFDIVSSLQSCPKYTTEAGVKKEGQFTVKINDTKLDKKRKVEVSMNFGASLISVTARRLNFGDKTSIAGGLEVEFAPN